MLSGVFEVGAGLFGACIGSFLNVVVHRLPQADPEKRSLGGRSRCPHCGALIAWRDNLPVVAWFVLRGRARCCGQPISKRYPLVEALTALLFVALASWPPHGPPFEAGGWSGTALLALLCDAAFVSFLVACSFIDWDHRILPDALTIPYMVLGCTLVAWSLPGYAGRLGDELTPEFDSVLTSCVGLAAGFLVTWVVRVAARAVFAREAMGFGDVKFMGAIGAFLGWDGALLTFFLGCVVGAVGGSVHRLATRDAYVPFGPFLAIGAMLTLFVKRPIVKFLFETWPEWQRTSTLAPAIMVGAALFCILALVVLVRRGRGNG